MNAIANPPRLESAPRAPPKLMLMVSPAMKAASTNTDRLTPAMTVTMPMAADVQVDAWAVAILAIDATTGMAAMPMTAVPPAATSDLLCG